MDRKKAFETMREKLQSAASEEPFSVGFPPEKQFKGSGQVEPSRFHQVKFLRVVEDRRAHLNGSTTFQRIVRSKVTGWVETAKSKEKIASEQILQPGGLAAIRDSLDAQKADGLFTEIWAEVEANTETIWDEAQDAARSHRRRNF